MSPSDSTGLRALVVDDHPIVVNAIAATLRAMQVFRSVESVRSLKEAREALQAGPDYSVILLDLHLADADGLDALVALREEYPNIPIVVFSSDDSLETIVKAFEGGARGYIPKSSPLEVVFGAINVVLAGSSYVPPHAARALGIEISKSTTPQTRQPGPPYMSPRQRDVLQLLLLGMPNKVIARRLGMAEGTVKTHLNTIYRLIGVRNRAQAVLRAHAFGLL